MVLLAMMNSVALVMVYLLVLVPMVQLMACVGYRAKVTWYLCSTCIMGVLVMVQLELFVVMPGYFC